MMGDDGIFFRGFCLALGLVMVGGLHEESAFARNGDISDSVSWSDMKQGY